MGGPRGLGGIKRAIPGVKSSTKKGGKFLRGGGERLGKKGGEFEIKIVLCLGHGIDPQRFFFGAPKPGGPPKQFLVFGEKGT